MKIRQLSLLLFSLILVSVGCKSSQTPPAASPSPAQTVSSQATPTPEDKGEWRWRVYLASPGVIHSAQVSTTGHIDSIAASKFDKMGPPTTRMVMNGNTISMKQETQGIQFQCKGVLDGHLLANEAYGSLLFAIPLKEGLPSDLKPSKLKPVIMHSELLPSTKSLYLSDGNTNAIVRFQLTDSGIEKKASYQTRASLPGIELDPESKTLWVAEGKLTQFDLASDPDLKKPKTLLEGAYEDVTYIPGSKQLVLEIKVPGEVLSDKAFEIYSLEDDGLKKQGVVQPKPDAYAYGFTADGKWMLVGGSHAEDKLWSYKLEGGKITQVGTLEIASGADHLDVHGNLILIDRRNSTIIVRLEDDGKLTLCQTLPGSGAIMAPLGSN